MEFLTVSGISLEEHGNRVLQNISFRQPAHHRLALAGESGTGKSTLLQIIAGLIQPSAGEVRVSGDRVRGPVEVLVPGHPGVAYLSQKSDLPHSLRVEQVLRYANKRPPAEAQALYALCRIDHLMQRRTDQLSGGEQQRVALARLLLGAPRLLLLDEPFSNLDRGHKRTLQSIIDELGTRLGITCLLVSHDAADTLPWADEILVLHQGHIVQQGSPEQIYRQPANEYTAALFGDYNLVRGVARRQLAPRHAAAAALLVRPEAFQLSLTKPGLKGTVTTVRYFGNHDEVEVALSENTVRVRQPTGQWAVGQIVFVSLVPGGGWPLEE
ncbi:ABC transporter ATP-binding protein [Hymenobacter properus]|uniref:ABC transporter ATP-binding protein n=1 Tax=Hymenobacter properus TaxID=2791026 RepID=A0A931FI08_9BACT|nr:ABC transporter ATP-binding protein [Hymenobacter properus]MBF9140263.1 ABC transporter ATP-binding protein [Hymenobacter properus]MBR7719070.1 ABC transporter ATP-binding protein [Microvirga sp. SRT04]